MSAHTVQVPSPAFSSEVCRAIVDPPKTKGWYSGLTYLQASDVDVGGGASNCSRSPPPKKRRTRSWSAVEGTATPPRGKAYDLRRGRSEQSLVEPPEELALAFEDSYSYILPIAEVLELTNNVPFDIEKLCAEGNYSDAGGQMLPYHGGSPSSVVEGSFEDEEEKEEEKEEGEKEEEEKEEEEKVRSTATCRTLTDTRIMPPVTPVGRGGSAGPPTGGDKIAGASSQSSNPTNPSGCGDGEPDGETEDTVVRRMSDRHRARLSEALVDWRQHRAQNLGARFAPVLLSDAEIEEIADKVPTTTDDLRTVGTWRGSRKLANHGASLIAAIKTFLAANKMAPGENIPCGGQGARARDGGMTRSPHGHPRRYRTRASLDDSR